ncbi:bifunctional diaminohydroxyphosphoribosylaminopyrimidine deaminase/5-amino-6-(5-phosphoribosylamino)uracil reductase RibD [Candidatus Peregrinibacteria bacterium]|nr:bifunctional diaminohydroxyphosphoribosylaminopyrimidine deaminase/5-amino-6-(5-phosphoribosylamino)uracil reductase RibD [Candidatus Peregrinibacteria bacterium]
MRRCLLLAGRGRGLVGNGALVGAVLVSKEKIIAEGWHSAFGSEHAEVNLIKKLDRKIPHESGLYVNLEPCNHHGKTPPCTDAIIQSGIRRVVIGMWDPDPRVQGRGAAALRAAGIEVIGPVLPEECRRFNRGFVSARESSRPYITLKNARTLDGAFANPDGSKRKITSVSQDRWSHQFLRARHDAILVGAGTVLSDNPSLLVRLPHYEAPQPYRILLDPAASIPGSAAVLVDENAERTIHITDLPQENGRFVWKELWSLLMTPREGFHGVTSILVEGGPRVWKSFREEGCVDEEVTLMGM